MNRTARPRVRELHMTFAEFVSLVHAIIWPVVVVALAVTYRKELPRLVQTVGGRISHLSLAGVKLDFAALETVPETLRVKLDEIREPSTTGPPPPSGVKSLIELATSSPPADYLVIDLRDGQAWLTSRLYLFAVVLPPILGLRCFVFVGTRDGMPRYFFGFASPPVVVRSLEEHYPWLRHAMAEMALQPLFVGKPPTRYTSWTPYGDVQAALQRLTAGGPANDWNLQRAEALSEVIRALVSPIDLFQPGGVELFVNRFLENPNLRRAHNASITDEDWVHLDSVDEHARWIKDERHLLDVLGDGLSRQKLVINQNSDDETLVKAALRRRGNFVAVTDADGRFERLIDRTELVEKLATGTGGG